MQKRALSMSRGDARAAAVQERVHRRLQEQCTQQLVQVAAAKHAYRSSPAKAVRFTAAIALQR